MMARVLVWGVVQQGPVQYVGEPVDDLEVRSARSHPDFGRTSMNWNRSATNAGAGKADGSRPIRAGGMSENAAVWLRCTGPVRLNDSGTPT